MSNKYEREIEEILKQAGESPSKKKQKGPEQNLLRSWWSQLDSSVGGQRLRISPGRIALIAVGVLVSAIVLRSFMSGISTPLFWLALGLFIVAYALFLARPQSYEKRWRGRVVSYSRPTWRERVRRWLKK